MATNSLTKENAKDHCRICLRFLIACKNNNSTTKMNDEVMSESKQIFIDMNINRDLQIFITKLLNMEGITEYSYFDIEYPQKICFDCFHKLESFDRFRLKAVKSAERLQLLFKNSGSTTEGDSVITKTQNDCKDNSNSYILDSNGKSNEMYNLLDGLMETESILLNSDTLEKNNINASIDPDPFEPSFVEQRQTRSKAKKKKLETEKPIIESENSEEFDWIQKSNIFSDGDEVLKKSSAKSDEVEDDCKFIQAEAEKDDIKSEEDSGKDSDFESENLPKKTRRKRRTKKEMEELRRCQNNTAKRPPRRIKGLKNIYKCQQCNHSFAHKITLDAHVRKIHEGQKQPFKCDRCDKAYTFAGGLYTHIKEYHENESRAFRCDHPDCDRVYTAYITLQRHKRLKHSDTPPENLYVCEQCGATFNQSANLKYHMKTRHPTQEQLAAKAQIKERFECDVCQKLFHSRYTLKYHKLQLHSTDMNYECKVCGRRMAKKFMLIQHMLVHSDDTEKMPCEMCGKKFIRKFELESHIKAVHMKLKPFECQYCSECFASRKTLRHHEYIHTGEKPYVCNICGQAFRQQTCLKNHRRTHEKISDAENLYGSNLNRNFLSNLTQQSSPTASDASILKGSLT
uniref:Protein krueppel n=1 Tax=Glossina brevipalpis TaxID=37001 RepID=A0A1A9W1W9_9MUSC